MADLFRGVLNYAAWLQELSWGNVVALVVPALCALISLYATIALFLKGIGPGMEFGILTQMEAGVMEGPIQWSYPTRRKEHAKLRYMSWVDSNVEWTLAKIDELIPRQQSYTPSDIRSLAAACGYCLRNELLACKELRDVQALAESVRNLLQTRGATRLEKLELSKMAPVTETPPEPVTGEGPKT